MGRVGQVGLVGQVGRVGWSGGSGRKRFFSNRSCSTHLPYLAYLLRPPYQPFYAREREPAKTRATPPATATIPTIGDNGIVFCLSVDA